ncbi:hypothetical protein HYO45_22715 [Vibrio parahaemolyticus]|nr:hypothetical protein [Vibrio parahaemolyticus]
MAKFRVSVAHTLMRRYVSGGTTTKMLEVEDYKRCSLIIRRGCYFYSKLYQEHMNGIDPKNDEICVIAYYILSLAELTVGMRLWLKSEANIKALGDAVLIDHTHLLAKKANQKRKQGKNLHEMDLAALEHAKDKYHALYYPDGRCQISKHRKSDDLFEDTLALTSKLVHQDEFSILGFTDESPFSSLYMGVGNKLISISEFWLCDFKNAICILNNELPDIVSYCTNNVAEIPFDYSEISFQFET